MHQFAMATKMPTPQSALKLNSSLSPQCRWLAPNGKLPGLFPAIKIAPRYGYTLWTLYAAVHGDHPGQVLHRVHHGDHRAAMDDHLLFRRRDSRLVVDGPGASDRRLRNGRDERRCDHYRTDRAVLLHGGAHLSLRTVSDRTARSQVLFRGNDR